MGGNGEGGVDGGFVADVPVVAEIAGDVVVDQGRAGGDGGLHGGDAGEVFVVYLY